VWALFLATPLVPIIDRLFSAEKFSWRPDRSAPADRRVVGEHLTGC
jgi:hypothetical protein